MSKWVNALMIESGDVIIAKPFRKESELFEPEERLALCTLRRPGYVAILYENGEVYSCKPEDLQTRFPEDKDLANFNNETLNTFKNLGVMFSNGSR